MYVHISALFPIRVDLSSSLVVIILSRSTVVIADVIVVAATWLNQSVRSSALSGAKEVGIPSFAKVLLIDGEYLCQSGVVEVTEDA